MLRKIQFIMGELPSQLLEIVVVRLYTKDQDQRAASPEHGSKDLLPKFLVFLDFHHQLVPQNRQTRKLHRF